MIQAWLTQRKTSHAAIPYVEQDGSVFTVVGISVLSKRGGHTLMTAEQGDLKVQLVNDKLVQLQESQNEEANLLAIAWSSNNHRPCQTQEKSSRRDKE